VELYKEKEMKSEPAVLPNPCLEEEEEEEEEITKSTAFSCFHIIIHFPFQV
jgi:hypothetical protein